MKFGDKIKYLRKERNISREELAKKLNISYAALSKYETNERFPRDETFLNKVANFFNVSTDYLFGRSNERNPKKDSKNIIETIKINTLKENIDELPPEALEQIDEYIRFLKIKYKK